MVSTRSIAAASVAALSVADAFAPPPGRSAPPARRGLGAPPPPSSLRMQPKGCAARPFEKKNVAVFGAGGYLGAIIFGFLQRAGALYGTGIAGTSSPRAICATGPSSAAINKVLASAFKAAYAGEDLMRLVDTSDVSHIAQRLKNFDAAIIGTTYELERRAVTLNTYEASVNDRTYEMYLDEKYGAWKRDDDPRDDAEVHASIFRNSVRACREAGVSHVVAVETPRTARPADFVDVLEEEGVAYTYVRTRAPLTKDKYYTFEKGITNRLGVVAMPAGSRLEPFDAQASEGESVYREDLAALIVQSLMTLEWGESRILEVSHTPGSEISTGYGGKSKESQRLKFDKDWCPNSGLLAEVLSSL